ncbi:MAG: hypothetical protein AAGI37_06465 [Planctomycetota bacterium]
MLDDELDQLIADDRALGLSEHQALAGLVVDGIQPELLANDADTIEYESGCGCLIDIQVLYRRLKRL